MRRPNNKNNIVCGIGINDANYEVKIKERLVDENGKVTYKQKYKCPYYTKWGSMIRRCYSSKSNVAYSDCSVCEEWLTFSNFKFWMEQQDWEGKCLDKDLLVYQNKVYSPETCCFVTHEVNNFLTRRDRSRGDYPLGVYLSKGKYKAQIQFTNKRISLGSAFLSPNVAHRAWQQAKIEKLKLLVTIQEDSRTIKGLNRVLAKIQEDYDRNIETKDF